MDPDLRPRLAEAIRRARIEWAREPMAWGASDCALAVMDIYRAVLGTDPAAPWRGRYASEAEAKAVLGAGGLSKALGQAAGAMGWPRIAPDAARPGDLGLIATPDGPAAAIRGEAHWLHRLDRGFAVLPVSAVRRAWGVQ